MKKIFQCSFFCQLVLIILISITNVTYAETENLTIKNITEAKESIEELIERKQHGINSLKQDKTPLYTLIAIRDALRHKRWEEAGKYLDMRFVPKEISEQGAGELIRKLSLVWTQQKVLDFSIISDDVEGQKDDNLPSYHDLIGNLQTSNGLIPILLQKVPDENGGRIWKISNATVVKIPQLWDEFGYSQYIENLAKYLPDFTVFNMNNWQIIAFIILITLAWFVTGIYKRIVITFFTENKENSAILTRFFGLSLRMFLFFMLIDHGASYLGLSIIAKVWLASGTLVYLASIFLILGLLNLFTELHLLRIHDDSTAIIRPLMTTLKLIIIIVLGLNWFEGAGYNVATILTGLGIGSLAIALAAQKTLENIFGAFTLYIAKPIKPGDFCKFGDITGTVEEIGLRSTCIRKLNRTLVHVPNSVISSKELENYADIDRRLYHKELRFRLDTSPDQLRELLIKLRDLLLCHARVLAVDSRVRFDNIERDAFVIEIYCYINTKTIADYKAIAEDLNLHILDIIRNLGVHLAIPQQQVMLGKASPTDDNLVADAKEKMDGLRVEGKLPFPDFSTKESKERRNSLSYPGAGTLGKPLVDD